MEIVIEPISDAVGAEVRGVDLSQELESQTFQQISEAFSQYLVLLFRNQDLSSQDQVRFARMFGELQAVRSRPSYTDEYVMYVANKPVDGKEGVLPDGEMHFHFDQCYYETPAQATLLHALEIPSKGGHTFFSNAQRVFDSLDETLKARLRTLQALNVYDYESNPTKRRSELSPDAPRCVHPAVIRHPKTGRESLYVNRLMTHHLVGVDPEESQQLLEMLWDRTESSEFVYEHEWQLQDLVMWDNFCTLHARSDFDPKEKRVMRRVTVKGDLRPQGTILLEEEKAHSSG